MDIVIWIGAAITALGFAGILWSLASVLRARRAGLADAELRARIQRALPVNIGALLLSILGLMVVGAGVLLG
ncbi:MAG: hypothetical protein IT542_13240 [Rubellimicrobium sp.]|nr:hypothetical protein [Rubellimicrobium sp.]